jgi:hypothetical protein
MSNKSSSDNNTQHSHFTRQCTACQRLQGRIEDYGPRFLCEEQAFLRAFIERFFFFFITRDEYFKAEKSASRF